MKNLFNNRGTAILLTLPLLVVILVAVQISLTRAISFRDTINHFRSVGVRDSLVTNISAYAALGSTFRSSLHPSLPSGTNSELQNCVFGTGASPCPAAIEMPLTLYAPLSASAPSTAPNFKIISGPFPLAGGTSKPALYNANGVLCDATAEAAVTHCPFEVYTSFSAYCAGGAASCIKAESLTVRYFIRNISKSSILQLAAVDKFAPSILVSKILPGPDDSSTNVVISSYNSEVMGTETTTTETTYPNLSPVAEAVRKGAEGTYTLTIEQINFIADGFIRAGYTEDYLDFIEKITKHALPIVGVGCTTHLVRELGLAKITDINDAQFLVEVEVEDAEWMKIVLESGVQSSYMARTVYWHDTITDAQTLATSLAAIEGLPETYRVSGIAAIKTSTKEEAQAIYQNIKDIPSPYLAVGILMGGWHKDLTKMNAIVTALEGLTSGPAEAMGKLGITDATLAQNLNTLVSPISSSDTRQDLILKGLGDYAKTEILVNEYLAKYPPSTTTTLAESSTTSTTTSTAGTSTTTTTTTTSTTSTTTPPPDNLSLISTCTNCSDFTY